MSLLREIFGNPLKGKVESPLAPGKTANFRVLGYTPGRWAKLVLPSGEQIVISIGSATAKIFVRRSGFGWLIPKVVASERLSAWQSEYRSFNSFHRRLSRAMILDGLCNLLSAYRSVGDLRKAWPTLQNPVVVVGREMFGLPSGKAKQIAKREPEGGPEPPRESAERSRASGVPREWLRNRITVAEAEAKHMVNLGERAHSEFARSRGVPLTKGPVPFGFGNREWAQLVASMLDGDELWEYCSSDHSWEHLAGRAGIALVREGEIVDVITTEMN